MTCLASLASVFLERKANKLAGTSNLNKGAKNSGREPNPRQMRCSWVVRGTVLRECPPNSTQAIWMAMVATRMSKNKGLLKKLAKTLISLDLSFLALI